VTHSGDRMGEYTKPGYEAYARSVVTEVKPEIDRRIRVLASPRETGVIGSSLHLVFPLEEHDELAWGRRLHLPVPLGLGTATTAQRRRSGS